MEKYKTELRLKVVKSFLASDARSWLNLQQTYDLKVTQKQKGKQIEAEIDPLAWAG